MKEPVWILSATLIAVHDAQIAEHGGGEGIRDENLLESALAHPRNLFLYESPSVFDLAAAYASRIVGNHPFIDGNKRVGYMAMRLFLVLNGYDITASQEEKVRVIMELAAGDLPEKELSGWIRSKAAPVK
jgi:death-on-curing protein